MFFEYKSLNKFQNIIKNMSETEVYENKILLFKLDVIN